MNATYLIMSLPFLSLATLVWFFALGRLAARHPAPTMSRVTFVRATAVSVIVLGALTAVFDNVIIASGLVGYHASTRLGLAIGLAPVEDFGYTIAAALALPALTVLFGDGKHRD